MPAHPAVAFCADDNYAVMLAVAIRSLLHNTRIGRSLDVYVIDGGLGPDNQAKLHALVAGAPIDAQLHVVQPDLERLPRHNRLPWINRSTLLRLLLLDLIGADVERVLYLDSDVLFIGGDLDELWALDLGDHLLAAVMDPGCWNGYPELHELGFAPDAAYFNAGFLLLNARLCRKEHALERALQRAVELDGRLDFVDQDVLNLVCQRRWLPLSPRWNVMSRTLQFQHATSTGPLKDARDHPYMFHFTGPGRAGPGAMWWAKREDLKPIAFLCTHPLRERFFHELDQTPWSGWRPTMSGFVHECVDELRALLDKVAAADPSFDRDAFVSEYAERVAAWR
jgi:lipopolysaccharide biosynthesis glycosyltransferase